MLNTVKNYVSVKNEINKKFLSVSAKKHHRHRTGPEFIEINPQRSKQIDPGNLLSIRRDLAPRRPILLS